MSAIYFESKFAYAIEHMILPIFKGMLASGGMHSLYDRNGKLLMLSESQARIFGSDDIQKYIGCNLNNLPLDVLENISSRVNLPIQRVWLDFNQMFSLHQRVIHAREITQYIDLTPYYGNLYSHLVTVIPIFHPEGEVIAYQTQAVKFSISLLSGAFNKCLGVDFVEEDKFKISLPFEVEGIKLSERQYEILFLLSNGMSQYDAADFLQITRSTLAKILHTQIFNKFHISPTDFNLLIEKAVDLGINERIPLRLRKQKFFLFDPKIYC